MLYRERRSWTEDEDQLLRDAVELEESGSSNPSKWHAIAKHVPSRTNKDCRKRWFAKMASDVVKGGWAPEEDEKLVQAIEKYGTRWSLVSAFVQTRNSDQCAKRWTDTLNPMIDRTRWSPEADALLLNAVQEHGKLWTKIVRIYFPGRTGLSAKNRYNSITRFNSRAPRRKSYKHRCVSESASSVSSSSVASPLSSASSAPDTPQTPPSFELNPSVAVEDSYIENDQKSELIVEPSTWPSEDSAILGCSSSSLSPANLTFDELCTAMLSHTGLNGDVAGLTDYYNLQSGSIATQDLSPADSVSQWDNSLRLAIEEAYPQIPTFSERSSSPSSSLDSAEHFLPYTLERATLSHDALSPTPDTSSAHCLNTSHPDVYQVDEEITKVLDQHTDIYQNGYGYSNASLPMWGVAQPDTHSCLGQWTNTY